MTKIISLHIGKTGGSFLHHIINNVYKNNIIHFAGHNERLGDIKEAKYIFFVRNPITRFTSGFISRLRKGQPLYNAEWTNNEYVSFQNFKTPNELAEALSSHDKNTKTKALHAMNSIFHIKHDITFYLKSLENIKQCKDNILYIGKQETLNTDIQNIFNILQIPLKFDHTKYSDSIYKHETPGEYNTIKDLSDLAKQNLKTYYQSDYDILNYLGIYYTN
jgi:hypothetical protein